jgi:hypothetical protein
MSDATPDTTPDTTSGSAPDATSTTRPDPMTWDEAGIERDGRAAWEELGFGPFEAALAHGDGFAPGFVSHYKAALDKTVKAWEQVGLATGEGLRWHQAGFSAREAQRRRAEGVDLETARRRRVGTYA